MWTTETIISTFGYPGIIAGTFLEGETILVIAGFLAHQGYLSLPWVILCALAGTLTGDQFYFYIGYFKGRQILKKKRNWVARSVRVSDLLRRHRKLLIIGFRFVYGLRTITPLVLGTINVRPTQFLILNAIGAILWSIIISNLGYLFGGLLETWIGDIRRYELEILALVAAAGTSLWIVKRFLRKKKANT